MSDQTENMSETAGSTFHISSAPVVSPPSGSENPHPNESQFFPELPHSYTQPIVFAMARDPQTLFVYWDIDWPQTFAASAPAGRKVYLRVYDGEGSEIDQIIVEPMVRQCEVAVAEAGDSFRIELGYLDYNQKWHVVGTSEIVQTPPDKIGALSPGDFALVPFHITFQRLTEFFQATRIDEGSLIQSLRCLQEKSLHPEEHGSLAPEEREIYRAMRASISERTYLPRAPLDRTSEMQLQKKLEGILGFGARASSHSLGGSSKV